MVQFLFQAITPLAVHSTLKNEQGISGQRKVSGLDGPITYSVACPIKPAFPR